MVAGFTFTSQRQWILGDTEVRYPRSQSSAIKDPLFSEVSLLLPMSGTNGSTTFLDQSQYAAAITANGGAQISTGTYADGAYLGNGTNSFLTLASTNQALPGDFCIEAVVRLNSLSQYMPLVDARVAASFSNYVCGIFATTGRLDFVTAGGRVTGSSLAVSTGVDTHVAFERSDGTIYLYVNGVRDAASWANVTQLSPVSGTMRVAATVDPTYVDGQMRWLRITKAARYRDAFTPPVVPPLVR